MTRELLSGDQICEYHIDLHTPMSYFNFGKGLSSKRNRTMAIAIVATILIEHASTSKAQASVIHRARCVEGVGGNGLAIRFDSSIGDSIFCSIAYEASD